MAATLSNYPNDQQEALPTAAVLDAGYFSQTNGAGLLARQIDPYVATRREPHHVTGQSLLQPLPDPPSPDAPLAVQMAYKLRTAIGQRIYAVRKATVEPVIGIIKEVLGFRRIPLRGFAKDILT